MKFYLNQYFSQTSSHEIVRRNVKLTRENLNLGSKIKHLSPVYRETHRKAAQTTAKLVSSESKNEPNTTCPQISFSGHPRHGAVGQNIFPMYISIKRHSWFFKSSWCLLYFGRDVQTRTTGKCWRQKTPFCLKIVRTCAMTPKAAILCKIVHTCAKECLILKYKYVQNPWYQARSVYCGIHACAVQCEWALLYDVYSATTQLYM